MYVALQERRCISVEKCDCTTVYRDNLVYFFFYVDVSGRGVDGKVMGKLLC